ncbi:MAG TPA: endolytic transglycosylase MltG [Mycobacteriales bacterium]|jgi:UPF0755 protein
MSEHGFALPFEDEPDSRRARRRRREKQKRDRRRAVTAMILVLTIFVLLAGGVWYGVDKVGALIAAPDYSGSGTGQVVVQIKPGDTASDIAVTLQAEGVIKSTKAFVDAAKSDKRSLSLQPGSYQVHRQMKAADALDLLLSAASKVTLRFTVPEGLSAKRAFDRIAEQTKFTAAQLDAATKDPAAIGLPAWAKGDVEGFLFPDTYLLDPGTDAVGVVSAMVARSLQVMDQINFIGRARQLNLEPMDALKVASLLEGEGIPSDFGKIARVVYNRLFKQHMPLQFDSTTVYGREIRGVHRQTALSHAELNRSDDIYSTYTHTGLPPTPISNPGKAALEAAVAPEDGPWLYFVLASKGGHSEFATTYAEHQRNIAKCKAVGGCGG